MNLHNKPIKIPPKKAETYKNHRYDSKKLVFI